MVTFQVFQTQATECKENNSYHDIVMKKKELKKAGCSKILQSSPMDGAFAFASNGFVDGVVRAYNKHHNLVIRPDDVWLAIMIQFGTYVNGNADSLRSKFVEHDGKKTMPVYRTGTLHTIDYGSVAEEMVGHMNNNLKDPELGKWILPDFSTTTPHDTIVGSIVMMAAMKEYFAFVCFCDCGIPEITLLGTVEDWEDIRSRVGKLGEYGGEMQQWSIMLGSILDQFVCTAKGQVNVDFWKGICDVDYLSGSSALTGWMSVFCTFNDKGKWQLRYNPYEINEGVVPRSLRVELEDVPLGYLTVDLKINDNGEEHEALMIAGHLTYEVQDKTTIAPHLGWAIALKEPTKK